MRFILHECFENTAKRIWEHPPSRNLRLKSMFDKPQIKPNNGPALQEFHQQIKLNITWFSRLGYKTPLYSNDSVTKAILHLL